MSDFSCWSCGGPADAVDELCADCDKARAADERKAEELRAEIERAVLAEREACARVADEHAVRWDREIDHCGGAASIIADAIRARRGE